MGSSGEFQVKTKRERRRPKGLYSLPLKPDKIQKTKPCCSGPNIGLGRQGKNEKNSNEHFHELDLETLEKNPKPFTLDPHSGDSTSIFSPGALPGTQPLTSHARLRRLPGWRGSQEQLPAGPSAHQFPQSEQHGFQKGTAEAGSSLLTQSTGERSKRTGSTLLCVSQLHSGQEMISS